jgi:hypothetical protein
MSRLHLPASPAVLVIVVSVVALGWFAFAHFRSAATVAPNCVVGGASEPPVCTPDWIIGRDPYCVVDPTCVSPFYQRSRDDLFPHWQGEATSLWDPSLGGHEGYESIAVVNFGLFVLAVIVMVALLRFVRTDVRFIAMLALLVWCLLEWARWSYAIWTYTREFGPFSPEHYLKSPYTYLGLIVTAIPVFAVGWFLYRQVRSESGRGADDRLILNTN